MVFTVLVTKSERTPTRSNTNTYLISYKEYQKTQQCYLLTTMENVFEAKVIDFSDFSMEKESQSQSQITAI